MTPGADDEDTYRLYAADLRSYATALVGPADAADVVADTLISAFGSPGWDAVENRRAYLYRAVLNRASSYHRSRLRRLRRETMMARRDVSDVGPPESEELDVHRAMERLSKQQRAVIYLTYWEQMQPAEIAELLRISDGSVRKQLARARETLRRILDA